MKESSKVLVGLGLGLVAGGIAGYFLNSDEGRVVQDQAKKKLSEVQETVSTSVKNNAEIVNEKVSVATSSATAWANDVANTVKSKISSTSDAAEDIVEDAQDDFQSGASRARRIINNKAETISEIVEDGRVS